MKKIFTLCLALFCATATFAQNDNNFNSKGTFVFTDKDGNVYEDGDVITRDEAEESPFGGIADLFERVKLLVAQQHIDC
jgi:hypothetical protein